MKPEDILEQMLITFTIGELVDKTVLLKTN
jgi:hypothetical protein